MSIPIRVIILYPIRGIMIYGVTGMLQGKDDAVPVVTNDPVYLSREYIESGIASGSLQAGAFNNVHVHPPRDQWPEEWRFLKE
jgi:hypothetical protein